MQMIANVEGLDLIEVLHQGGMLSQPAIQHHVDRALHTGDYGGLKDFIERYPVFLAQAQRNKALAHVQSLQNPYRPYPTHDEVQEFLSGPIKFGYVNARSDMFGAHWDTFCLPTIVPGRIRSGKSQLLKYLLCQILREKRSFNTLVPDLKREYRDLLTVTTNLKVLRNNRVKINPLAVPSWRNPLEHLLLYPKIFVTENYLGGTSENVLVSEIEYLYRKRGIFDGSINYPILRDLYNLISHKLDTYKSLRYRDIMLWLQNRLKPYSLSDNFNCRVGIPNDVWSKENLVLEMDEGFMDNMYRFVVSYIIGLQYTHNKKMGLVGTKLRSLWNIDEGRILLEANRDLSAFGESFLSETCTKMAEHGVALIISSPETASFNQTIRSISYTKICFPLTDGKDRDWVTESFGLSEEQSDFVFRLPRYGQAICRYGGYEKPFLLAVPHFNLKKHLTDEEVEERMAPFYAELDSRIKHVETPRPLETTERMAPNAAALLYFLGKAPFTKMSDMIKAPGFNSPAEVNKALEWLEKNDFIRRQNFRVSKRGRKSNFAPLTEKAYRYLNTKGPKGKGDFEHRLYQDIIEKKEKPQAIEVKIEGRIKGSNKAIDVLARYKDRGYVAFEVTLHFENLIGNIVQDFSSGADEVVVVTRDRADLERAVKKVGQEQSLNQYLEKISFRSMDDFFD